MNQTAVAAALGLSMPWSLSDKAQFPKPTSNDGARNVCGTSSDIVTFQSLMMQVTANGWRWGTDDLAAPNWAMMSVTLVFYAASRRGGGLFD